MAYSLITLVSPTSMPLLHLHIYLSGLTQSRQWHLPSSTPPLSSYSPYNVMNVLLASSSTLSFSCYFWCTALALPKLLIHCSVGTTIRSFAESAKNHGGAGGGEEQAVDGTSPDDDEGLAREMSGQRMKAIAGVVGILLCVGKLSLRMKQSSTSATRA